MVAAVAVVERELGEHAAAVEHVRLQQREHATRALDLAGEPQVHAFDPALALVVVGIDDVVRGLVRGVRLQLEAQARMTGAHDRVRRESILRAEVTSQAQLRALQRQLGWIHAARDVVLVGRGLRGVTLDPLLRAAVTRLAADAIAQLELRPALVARDVVGVAVDADLRGGRARQAEVRSDAFRFGELERAIRLCVPVLARPGLVFVQRDVLAGRGSELAVAHGGGAGGDAEMLVVGDAGLGREGAGRRPQTALMQSSAYDDRFHFVASPTRVCRSHRDTACASPADSAGASRGGRTRRSGCPSRRRRGRARGRATGSAPACPSRSSRSAAASAPG